MYSIIYSISHARETVQLYCIASHVEAVYLSGFPLCCLANTHGPRLACILKNASISLCASWKLLAPPNRIVDQMSDTISSVGVGVGAAVGEVVDGLGVGAAVGGTVDGLGVGTAVVGGWIQRHFFPSP